METQASLVGSDGVVELYAISCIGLDFTVVIDPGYLECENPVRLIKSSFLSHQKTPGYALNNLHSGKFI